MKMAACIFVLVLLCGASATATERQILSCDSTAGFGTNGGVSPAAASSHQEGSGAIKVTVASGGYTYKDLAVADQGSFWNSYDAIKFWVRGESGATWGVIDLWYDSSSYYHYYATFPITAGTWTEVVIPWNEFTQRNFAGPIESHRAEVFGVSFRNLLAHDETAPLGVVPPQVYDVDDIRLVDGISVTTPTNGTGDIRNTVAKMVAKQPVTIVVMGASITWGLKLQPNQATDRWSTQLETLLRSHYGYSNINVINTAVGGYNSWEGAISLGYDVYSHANIDLVILGDYYFNDYDDAIATGGPAEVADNFARLFDMLLSHGFYCKSFPAHEVMFCNGGLNAETGNLSRNDAYLHALEANVTARNIPTANYYYPLQALGEPYLGNNYYVFSGDYAHPNTAGHTYIADKIYNAIINAGGPVGNPVTSSASTVTFTAVVGSTTAVTQSITLTNTSGGSITVTPTNGGTAWLNVGSASTITAGNTATLTFSADPTGLSGTYTGTITLTNSTGAVRTLPVSFSVSPPPNLVTVSAPSVFFSAPQGSVTAVTRTITLTNTSASSITVTPTSGITGWLNVGSAVTIPAGNTATLTFTADPTGLNGSYSGTITLTNSTGATRTLPVSFTVGTATATSKKGGCDLTVGSNDLTASGAIGTAGLLAGFLIVLGVLTAPLRNDHQSRR